MKSNWKNYDGSKTRGERNKSAKLTSKQVTNIRYFRGQGRSQKSLCKTFGISRTQLWRIINRKAWAWL